METVIICTRWGGGCLQTAPWLCKRQRKTRPGTGRKHQNTEFYHFRSPPWSLKFPGMLLWRMGSPGPAVDGTGWWLFSLALPSVLDRLPPSPTCGPSKGEDLADTGDLPASPSSSPQLPNPSLISKLLTDTSHSVPRVFQQSPRLVP